MGSEIMASCEDCLDGEGEVKDDSYRGQGEVKGGGVDFGVINSLLGEILGELVDEHTAEDDIEVFSTKPGLDWISAHNFLTRLQKLSSYASCHLEVSELAACLEKALFSCTSGHVEVYQNLLLIFHS
ncbi:hypothetical protein Tco_1465928 [Tanacetum coccineum]